MKSTMHNTIDSVLSVMRNDGWDSIEMYGHHPKTKAYYDLQNIRDNMAIGDEIASRRPDNLDSSQQIKLAIIGKAMELAFMSSMNPIVIDQSMYESIDTLCAELVGLAMHASDRLQRIEEVQATCNGRFAGGDREYRCGESKRCAEQKKEHEELEANGVGHRIAPLKVLQGGQGQDEPKPRAFGKVYNTGVAAGSIPDIFSISEVKDNATGIFTTLNADISSPLIEKYCPDLQPDEHGWCSCSEPLFPRNYFSIRIRPNGTIVQSNGIACSGCYGIVKQTINIKPNVEKVPELITQPA